MTPDPFGKLNMLPVEAETNPASLEKAKPIFAGNTKALVDKITKLQKQLVDQSDIAKENAHLVEYYVAKYNEWETELTALRSQVDAMKAEHKSQACAGESLTDTLTRLRFAADNAQAERDALKAQVVVIATKLREVLDDGLLTNSKTWVENSEQALAQLEGK